MADTSTEDTSATLDTTTLQAYRHEAAELEERMRSVSQASSMVAENIRNFVDDVKSAKDRELPKLDLLRGFNSGDNQAARSSGVDRERSEGETSTLEGSRVGVKEAAAAATPAPTEGKTTFTSAVSDQHENSKDYILTPLSRAQIRVSGPRPQGGAPFIDKRRIHDGTNTRSGQQDAHTTALAGTAKSLTSSRPTETSHLMTTSKTIPLNAANHRIDPIPRRPQHFPEDTKHRLNTLKRRPCLNHYLKHHCPYGEQCRFTHTTLSADLIGLMRKLAAKIPCRAGGACREAGCYFGYHCVVLECKGEAPYCMFGREGHGVDQSVAMLVPSS